MATTSVPGEFKGLIDRRFTASTRKWGPEPAGPVVNVRCDSFVARADPGSPGGRSGDAGPPVRYPKVYASGLPFSCTGSPAGSRATTYVPAGGAGPGPWSPLADPCSWSSLSP